MLKRFIRIAIALPILLLLAAAGAIVIAGLNDRIANADMIVVPGNEVMANGAPSSRLKARLDAALRVFRERHAPLVFVSGGVGKSGRDEAMAMAAYLQSQGVPAAAIVIDSAGFDTAATAKNAALYLRAHHLKTALVATQYFHVPRTRLALERQGVTVTGSVHADYVEARDVYSTLREVAAYAFYYFER